MSQKMGVFILKSSTGDAQAAKLLPMVDVAVTLVMHEGQILLGYNEKWGAFTLPSTKRRSWEDPNAAKESVREEDWEDAAVRAAAEWVGRTLTVKPEYIGEVPEFQQSDRDGKWKRYRMRAYHVEVADTSMTTSQRCTEWLTIEEVLDKARRPISPTARHVVAELNLLGVL